MQRRTKLHLNHIEKYDSPTPFDGLTYALRTDANHATALLKKNILHNFNKAAQPDAVRYVDQTVHKAYRAWGQDILKAISTGLNYSQYGIEDAQNRFLNVHFYNARDLARDAVKKGRALIRQTMPEHGQKPIFFISLDDMVDKNNTHWGEFSFSRLFDPAISTYSEYCARPGAKPLQDQLSGLVSFAKKFHDTNGYKLPIILLEDNVRHAKMVNMIIGMMEESGLFQQADLAGISTCFCCADQDERAKIQRSDGTVIPVISVVDYKGAKIDVATPRDLLFDGYVVKTSDGTGRLPAIFMDAAKLFKIAPEHAAAFDAKVLKANLKFCERLESRFKTDLPLRWFAGASAISHFGGHSIDAPMRDVLRANDNARKQAALNIAP